MESEKEIKTDPFLVILIFVILVGASVIAISSHLNSQGEDKIPLNKQGEDNLNEAIVSGTAQKITLPPIGGGTKLPENPELVTPPTTTPTTAKPPSPTPPMELKKDIKYQAALTTTEGKIVIELDTVNTPITSNNFIFLAKKGFYEATTFHRVISGFMIQGGDPTGTGSGGPGYRFDDEPVVGEYTRGTVAMANAGPNTNGSQFFIMHQDKSLQKNYVIFGKVVEGMDVVDKIASAETSVSSSGEKSKPVSPVSVKSVNIIETPNDL